MKTLLVALFSVFAVLPAAWSQDADARLERAWTTPVRSDAVGVVGALGIVRAQDLLLVEDDRGMLNALRLSDGRPRWFVRTPAPLRHPPTAHAGRITFTAGERLFVVDAASGAVVFEQATSLAASAAPVTVFDGVFVPSYARSGLVAISMTYGTTEWTLRLPGDVIGPALATPDEHVVVTLDDGTVRAVDATLTPPRRATWTAHVGDVVGRAVDEHDAILVATLQPELVCLDAGAGARRWVARPGSAITGPPVASRRNDVVLVGLVDGLAAVRFTDGEELWRSDDVEWPVGFVEPGAVLVRRRDGTSALRDTKTGAVLLDGLSSDLLPCGEFAVAWNDDQSITAYRLVR